MKEWLKRIWAGRHDIKETPAADAYNHWAASYDHQPDNIVLTEEATLFHALLQRIPDIPHLCIADIGCGTGRHWPALYARNPLELTGFDVSQGMLDQLKKKFPGALTHCIDPDINTNLPLSHCQLIVSTLALAHIENGLAAFTGWLRALKSGGYLLLTDYHPGLLKTGGNRTFTNNGKTIAIRNYVVETDALRAAIEREACTERCFEEIYIDEKLRDAYAAQNALDLYKTYFGKPLLYGLLLQKNL